MIAFAQRRGREQNTARTRSPANGRQNSGSADRVHPIGERSCGQGAGHALRERLLLRPAVEGEFVFDGAVGQIDTGLPDAVSVRIVQRPTAAAPTVETAVEVNRAKAARKGVHVDSKSHRVLGFESEDSKESAAEEKKAFRKGHNQTIQ